MSKPIDLTGMTFGRWTVLGFGDPRHVGHNTMFLCRCSCGKEKDVSAANLQSGSSQSCGCLRSQIFSAKYTRDLTGQRFGRWTVLYKAPKATSNCHVKWHCLCDCGQERDIAAYALVGGTSTSCGCSFQIPVQGGSASSLYHVWNSMLQRCENPHRESYQRYGQRGIKVCDEWHSYPKLEQWALSAGYCKGLSIDRIDVNGGYEPENCRWVNMTTQARNRRNTIYVTYGGRQQSLADWADEYGMTYHALWERYVRYSWDFERALTTPIKKRTIPTEERVAS